MADGFIVRKGGVAVDITAAPSINFVSKTFDSITFTITNNDVLTADIFWEIGDSTPDANTFSLAGGATSSNQVASGLDEEETYTIFAFANAEGKAGSQTTSQVRTTPAEPIVFTAATGGTTEEYDDGGKRYKSHTFTSNGNFVVSTAGNGDRNQVDYLIIAGGGGSFRQNSGAGGAGGYRTTFGTQGGLGTLDTKPTVTATSYTVTVGGGGNAGSSPTAGATDGGISEVLFSTTVTSTGGGAGGRGGGGPYGGFPGGSGGGSGFGISDGGTGTTNQGFAGGNVAATGSPFGTGGGGGAGEAGGNKNTSTGRAGHGGDGLSSIIRTGSAEFRAGGGGGSDEAGGSQTPGGNGGGGSGAVSGLSTPGSGTANTGGGAGGASGGSNSPGAQGGSGIVIIRYEIAPSV